MSTQTKCLIPNCKRTPRVRGMCSQCYQSAHQAVKQGKTSWEALESAGLCLHAGKQGGKSAFTKALDALQEKESKE